MTVNDLKEALVQKLGDHYYYAQAPTAAAYPYRVAHVGTGIDQISHEQLSLEIDYWGPKLSDLRDMIDADRGNGDPISPTGLDRMGVGTGAWLTFDQTTSVEDADKEIKHIRASYYVILYR